MNANANLPQGNLQNSPFHSPIMQEAYQAGGSRERYAMEKGNRRTVYLNNHKCLKFTYSIFREYQDANGAVYDTVTKHWID